MKPPLKIKDWLKERSEKNFFGEKQFIFKHYVSGIPPRRYVSRIKDDALFREGQTVEFNGRPYEIVEFDKNLVLVSITRKEGTITLATMTQINNLEEILKHTTVDVSNTFHT